VSELVLKVYEDEETAERVLDELRAAQAVRSASVGSARMVRVAADGAARSPRRNTTRSQKALA
jgi:hypothetical protein